MEIKLRPLTIYDIVPLFELRNHPGVIAQCRHRERVTEDDHLQWMFERVHRQSITRQWAIFIWGRAGNDLVGRLGISGAVNNIDISLFPLWQRKGFATQALQILERHLFLRGWDTLNALVRKTNDPAIRLFTQQGFRIMQQCIEPDFAEYRKELR